VIFFGHGVKK